MIYYYLLICDDVHTLRDRILFYHTDLFDVYTLAPTIWVANIGLLL